MNEIEGVWKKGISEENDNEGKVNHQLVYIARQTDKTTNFNAFILFG